MPKPIPSELKTSPAERIVFNGPFEEKKNYPFSIINNGKEKIAFVIKLSNEMRTMCEPSHGVLNPGENIWIRVHLEEFKPTVENTQPNTLTIEYCFPPEGSDKNFNPSWFRLNVIIRRKHVALDCGFVFPEISGCFHTPLNSVANMPKPIPSELKTSPAERIVFNGPFEEKKNYPFSIINNGKEKIAFMIKLSNEMRTMCEPSHGVLNPGENIWIRVHLEEFKPTVENTQPNTLTIEYCFPPEGSDKNFNPSWFRLNVIIRRKHVALEFNA
ncbi:Major sperm protein 1 [Trichinella murrelli]|uniref:Major sperm protein n=1 Tax=Trichinella murrelli TaxID=144512 RepID=A0A0V0TST8_9BILA|nr:Major sperm protein 1 [Trichinella murrelli]